MIFDEIKTEHFEELKAAAGAYAHRASLRIVEAKVRALEEKNRAIILEFTARRWTFTLPKSLKGVGYMSVTSFFDREFSIRPTNLILKSENFFTVYHKSICS